LSNQRLAKRNIPDLVSLRGKDRYQKPKTDIHIGNINLGRDFFAIAVPAQSGPKKRS
jgi:hypothetical protein